MLAVVCAVRTSELTCVAWEVPRELIASLCASPIVTTEIRCFVSRVHFPTPFPNLHYWHDWRLLLRVSLVSLSPVLLRVLRLCHSVSSNRSPPLFCLPDLPHSDSDLGDEHAS